MPLHDNQVNATCLLVGALCVSIEVPKDPKQYSPHQSPGTEQTNDSNSFMLVRVEYSSCDPTSWCLWSAELNLGGGDMQVRENMTADLSLLYAENNTARGCTDDD